MKFSQLGCHIILLALVFSTSACGASITTLEAKIPQIKETGQEQAKILIQEPEDDETILKALPNLEYPLELTSSGKAQLIDGIFEESIAPDSATKTKVRLGEIEILGDINGDNINDAVLTLVVDSGGSGTFTYLALVINQNGTPIPLATVFLGDRIIITNLVLQPGKVLVTMLTRETGEPMSLEPRMEVLRTFSLQDDQLVEDTR